MIVAACPRNHFVTALKLFKAGMFRRNPEDKQLTGVMEEGVACCVMKEGMYSDDEQGIMAIINDDNANAALDMATNEMEVLSFIANEVAGMTASNKVAEDVLATTKSRFGARAFSDQDSSDMCRAKRRSIPNSKAKLRKDNFERQDLKAKLRKVN